jgi:Penicillin binding protein transpeptidase domain
MIKLYRLSICLLLLCLIVSGNEFSVVAGGRSKSKPKVQKGPDVKALAKLERSGKLSKSDKKKLAQQRAAIRAAQLRAIAAHEAALKNGATTNIMNDDTAGQDPDVRTAAIQALDGKAGTVVVMDPNNGKVYAIVNQKMAIGSPVKPCSTVKPIVSIAALQENVFDPNVELTASHGRSMVLTDALARSDNPFFQELGRRLGYDSSSLRAKFWLRSTNRSEFAKRRRGICSRRIFGVDVEPWRWFWCDGDAALNLHRSHCKWGEFICSSHSEINRRRSKF